MSYSKKKEELQKPQQRMSKQMQWKLNINKGIPLGFTLSGYALGAILNLSGATALLAGFGIGKIAQFITSKIDKQITAQEENFA